MGTEEALREAFERDGFVVVPDLLTDDELAHYGAAVDAAVEHRTRNDTRSLEERSRYEQSFRQCQNLWEDHDDVRPLTFHPKIGEAAAALLGVDAVRIWHDQALYKEAGGRETDPHQDAPYWPIAEPNTITAWIPFQPSTLANGCMAYVPGSHASGLREFANIFMEDTSALLERPELAGRAPVDVEVPAGGVAFHHGLTVHTARANTTDQTRRVHTVIYFADGCTRSTRMAHMSVDRDGIEKGAPIAGAVTPIVWPRVGLPDPPPAMGVDAGVSPG